MTNIEALKSLCNAICNTFYPDVPTMEMMLFNEGINKSGVAVAKDVNIFRIAVRLVMGYVEGSRSENGISTSVRADAIKKSILGWCKEYGVDAEDVVEDGFVTIEDGSNRW